MEGLKDHCEGSFAWPRQLPVISMPQVPGESEVRAQPDGKDITDAFRTRSIEGAQTPGKKRETTSKHDVWFARSVLDLAHAAHSEGGVCPKGASLLLGRRDVETTKKAKTSVVNFLFTPEQNLLLNPTIGALGLDTIHSLDLSDIEILGWARLRGTEAGELTEQDQVLHAVMMRQDPSCIVAILDAREGAEAPLTCYRQGVSISACSSSTLPLIKFDAHVETRGNYSRGAHLTEQQHKNRANEKVCRTLDSLTEVTEDKETVRALQFDEATGPAAVESQVAGDL